MINLNDHPRLNRLHQALMPYYDVIIFVVTLLVSNYFWKFTIHGDEEGVGMVTWFGLNITAPFDYLSEQTTNAVYWVVSLFRDTLYQVDAVSLRFTSGSGSRIVWSCTPIKQSFIWLCLILATPALRYQATKETDAASIAKKRAHAWLHKLWYIPSGWFLIYGINILRISAIMLFIEFHPEWFNLLHTYIFKYLFYGIIFLMWVFYAERLRD